MKRFKLAELAVVSCGLLGVALSGCSRDHIEAINLANQGDKSVKVNVDGAIQKYEQAHKLDPTNHLILWKLAKAYEKMEDWDKMASTLASAVRIAPTFANYWYKRGFALMQQARNGNPDAYEQAKVPLSKCVEADPNYAHCYHELGEAQWWTDDEQNALSSYTKAIEHDPTVAYFYPPLAEAYNTFRLTEQAEAVLKEGTRLVPPGEKNNNALYGMYTLLFVAAQAKQDKPAMLAAVESAKEVAGDGHPEISFNLGSTYAVMDPPQKEKAVRLLNQFTKRACRGANAKKFKEQCQTANGLIQKLGS